MDALAGGAGLPELVEGAEREGLWGAAEPREGVCGESAGRRRVCVPEPDTAGEEVERYAGGGCGRAVLPESDEGGCIYCSAEPGEVEDAGWRVRLSCGR